jgi:glycine cleavage system pyridoxal-binding protein P
MLGVVGFKSLDALIDATVPADIRREVRAVPWCQRLRLRQRASAHAATARARSR